MPVTKKKKKRKNLDSVEVGTTSSSSTNRTRKKIKDTDQSDVDSQNTIDTNSSNTLTLPTRRRAQSDQVNSDLAKNKKRKELLIKKNPPVELQLADSSDSPSNNKNSARKKKRKGADNEIVRMDPDFLKNSKLVTELSLNDSTGDNDQDFDESDSGIQTRYTSYDDNSANWTPLPNDADEAIKKLSDSFINKNLSDSDAILKEMVDAALSKNGNGVSREILNDIYFIARKRITDGDNPLTKELGLGDSDILQNAKNLVAAIDAMETKDSFIRRKAALGYLNFRLSNAPALDNKNIAFLDSKLENDYDTDLNDVSFIRPDLADESPLATKILDHRNKAMDVLDLVTPGLDDAFTSKLKKNQAQKQVLKANEALMASLKKIRDIQGKSIIRKQSDDAAIKDLAAAINAMQAAGQNFIMTAKKDDPNEATRIKLVRNTLEKLDDLTISNDRIINYNMGDAFDTLQNAAVEIGKINPKAATKFSEIVEKILTVEEDILVNDSPEATPLSPLLDDLNIILTGIKAPDNINAAKNQQSNLVKVPDSVSAIADVGSGISVGAGLAGDVFRSIRLIREIRAGDTSKYQFAEGGAIGTNLIKNSAAFAGIVGGAKVSADAVSVVGAGASIVLGAGYTVHGGIIYAKTSDQKKVAKGLGDDIEFKDALIKRIKTKQRRAILEAVGGTLAVVGGVVTIVATGGLATPLVVGLAAGITIASGVVGTGLAAERLKGKVKKDKGVARNELAETTFNYMQQAIAQGNLSSARDLAKALTNNKTKQYLMLAGADGVASIEDQQAALVFIRRYHNKSTHEMFVEHYHLKGDRLNYIGRIVHDVEVNTWEKKIMMETPKVQMDIQKLIMQENRLKIIKDCQIYFDAFYDKLSL